MQLVGSSGLLQEWDPAGCRVAQPLERGVPGVEEDTSDIVTGLSA